MDAHPPLPPEIWEHTLPAAQEMMVAPAAARAQLRAEVAQLQATVEEWAQRLGRHSRHASQPPSADPPPTTRPRRERSGRRPGGQPGHEGQSRALVPVEEANVVIPVKPMPCSRCQQPLPGDAPQPQRPQVTEIPPVQPLVMAYQLHQRRCPACGVPTRAERPAGVPAGAFGPRLQAITALGTGAYHRSKRTTHRVLEDLLHLSRSVGTMAHLELATAEAWAQPVEGARAEIQAPYTASLDDTGWREGRARAWLWTAVTAWVTVCIVRVSPSAKVAHALLGERFWGYVVTDRWRADTGYPVWRRQVCWAHLRRDLEAMIARGGPSQALGEAWRARARQMLHWWHRVRDGTRTQASVASSMRPIRRAVERLLEAGQPCGVPNTAGVCREVLKGRQAVWTFVRHTGVEPTNNAAERAIRPGVLWRKGRVGTQRAEGSRVVDVMMTVVATLTPPHRHVLDSVTAASEAAFRGEPAPSLWPTADDLNRLMHLAA